MVLSNPFVNYPRPFNKAVALIEAGSLITWDRFGKHKHRQDNAGTDVYRIHNNFLMKMLTKSLMQISFF